MYSMCIRWRRYLLFRLVCKFQEVCQKLIVERNSRNSAVKLVCNYVVLIETASSDH
jgi:hypothetical protein